MVRVSGAGAGLAFLGKPVLPTSAASPVAALQVATLAAALGEAARDALAAIALGELHVDADPVAGLVEAALDALAALRRRSRRPWRSARCCPRRWGPWPPKFVALVQAVGALGDLRVGSPVAGLVDVALGALAVDAGVGALGQAHVVAHVEVAAAVLAALIGALAAAGRPCW